MWKPGTDKPVTKSPKAPTPKSPKTPKQETSEHGLSLAGESSVSKPTSSSKKRLSGATRNMRFMKRKKEPQEQEEKVESGTDSLTAASSPKRDAVAPVQDDAMDVDDQIDESYSAATMVEMYGIQASLIGRRSFGGFNPHVEQTWYNSKASIEDKAIDPKKKISDDELLKQYADLVKGRSGSSRPVGNLKGKSKRKPNRRATSKS
jgi:hypothetical protein